MTWWKPTATGRRPAVHNDWQSFWFGISVGLISMHKTVCLEVPPGELNLNLCVSPQLQLLLTTKAIHLKLQGNTQNCGFRDDLGHIRYQKCVWEHHLPTSSPELLFPSPSAGVKARQAARGIADTVATAYFDDLLWSSHIIFIRELSPFPFCRG